MSVTVMGGFQQGKLKKMNHFSIFYKNSQTSKLMSCNYYTLGTDKCFVMVIGGKTGILLMACFQNLMTYTDL